MDGAQAFVEQVEHGRRRLKLPVREALTRHPKAFVYIVALRLAEPFTIYVVTAFAPSYSTSNLGMSRDLFLNIGLLAGAERRDDPVLRVARRPLRRAACPSPARSSGSHARCDASSRARRATVRIAICPVLHANVAHDMVVSVQQPRFPELFGAEYRYSGAGVGYPFASVVGGGFTPFIAVALASFGGGSWRVAPPRRRVSGGRLPRLDARRRADARRPSASPTRVASRLRMSKTPLDRRDWIAGLEKGLAIIEAFDISKAWVAAIDNGSRT